MHPHTTALVPHAPLERRVAGGEGVQHGLDRRRVAHPTEPGTAYLLPLQSDEYRCTPDGRCTVWRTRDAGGSWEPLTTGLPQHDAHLTVLRDAFTCDGGHPAGLFFGTRSGEVYGSVDEGDTWDLLAEHLPPVLSVRAAPVG